ncbi:MAG: hypothetical protein K2N87_04080 [Eubacterium sp.]|nr:hypothetical protein [Eubacterium sp.]
MRKWKEKEYNFLLLTGVSMLVLFGANRLFNAWIHEGQWVFAGDDLGSVTAYLNNTAMEYIFSIGANKFRPVWMAATYLILKISEGNWNLISEVLLFIHGINAVLVFVFIYRLQKELGIIQKNTMALLGTVLFLASHFSFYVNSELTGLIESMGYLLALGILFLLVLYTEEGNKKYYYFAVVLYGLLLYTHERYFVLFLLFAVAVAIASASFRKNFKMLLLPGLLLVSFWILRFILFGGRMVDGTGGTNIVETFNFLTVIKFCFSQVGYILGFQCGPQYMNGIEAGQVSWYINLYLIIRLVFIVFVLGLFCRLLFKDIAFRKKHLGNLCLFLCFIVLCIGSSSITIRVGMQWVYVSYTAFLIMLFWMLDALKGYYGIKCSVIFSFLLFFILTLMTENYYRHYYGNIANCEERTMTRALYHATVGKYGTEMEDREIIIISNNHFFKDMEQERWKQIFAPYINSSAMTVTYADSYNAARKSMAGNTVVLFEDREEKQYTDVTSLCQVYVDFVYGTYDDGWYEPDCLFEIEECSYSRAVLGFYYPGEMKDVLHGRILLNGKIYKEFCFTESWTELAVELEKHTANKIQIISDYVCVKNSDRGGADLCGTLSIRYE